MAPRNEVVRSAPSALQSPPKPGAAVSVAIVTYNVREYLRACLDSVLAERPSQVVVVDNASTDGTSDMVRAEYPQVTLLANMVNHGYGTAANQAFKSSVGDYVLLLNADTVVMPGAIAALAAYMSRHPRAAVVGPLVQYPDGSGQRSYFQFPGTLGWLLENEPLVWLLRYLPMGRNGFLCFTPPTVDRVVPWVNGAALLLRRTAFEAIGGFEESYFMYFEEIDLCLRLRAAQSETHFTPSATVRHARGASTSQCRTQMLIAHFRSCERFYRRHYSARRARFWMSLMRIKNAIRLARDLLSLRLESDAAKRAILSQQVEAWRTVLRRAPVPSA